MPNFSVEVSLEIQNEVMDYNDNNFDKAFSSPKKCFIATALSKMGFVDILVSEFIIYADGKRYKILNNKGMFSVIAFNVLNKIPFTIEFEELISVLSF